MKGVCTCLHLRRQVQKEQGKGDKEAVQGIKQKRKRREVDSKKETSSVMYLKQAQQHNI